MGVTAFLAITATSDQMQEALLPRALAQGDGGSKELRRAEGEGFRGFYALSLLLTNMTTVTIMD